jgi:hypothetical protein
MRRKSVPHPDRVDFLRYTPLIEASDILGNSTEVGQKVEPQKFLNKPTDAGDDFPWPGGGCHSILWMGADEFHSIEMVVPDCPNFGVYPNSCQS